MLFLPRTVYHSLINGTSPIDAIVFGMISQPVEAPDRFMSREVTVKLFSKKGAGTDLGALNLQRGRDHGIPGILLKMLYKYGIIYAFKNISSQFAIIIFCYSFNIVENAVRK